MDFNKIIELLNVSNKIAFALAFGAAVVLVGQHYQLPYFIQMPSALTSVALYFGILGAAVLLFNFLRLLWTLLMLTYYACKLRFRNLTVLSRVNELTLDQQAAIIWIAHHRDATIQGSPLEEPFRGLCNQGFLYLTDKSLFVQRFRVNRMVYWRKKKIGANFDKNLHSAIVQNDAPWKRRRLY
jgi:hypothetical protein